VALVAQSRLKPEALAEANALLAAESGATLANVSVWADRVVNPHTGPWHYINFEPGQCGMPEAARCEARSCVTAVLHEQLKLLRQPGTPDQRLDALKYLVHFVGDVHQPLHAGYADDRGGNRFQLRFDNKGSNLHRVWDSILLESWGLDASGLAAAAMAEPGKVAPLRLEFEPEAWAMESCALVQAPGFYPDLPAGRELSAEYVQAQRGVALRRVREAGWRLGAVLNEVFAPPAKPPKAKQK
jgi:hypothetical protein